MPVAASLVTGLKVLTNDFAFFRRNIKTTSNSSYLKGCTYDPDTAPLCPIFKFGKILELANVSFEEIAYQVTTPHALNLWFQFSKKCSLNILGDPDSS